MPKSLSAGTYACFDAVDSVSLILDGCVEPENLCQIFNSFRLVWKRIFERVKGYFVVNHAAPETCASPFTIILDGGIKGQDWQIYFLIMFEISSWSHLASDSTKESSLFCQGSDADEVGGVHHLVLLLHIQPAHQQALHVPPVAGSHGLGQLLAVAAGVLVNV